tara:strand:- start:231 stop:1673 length:1443 start_codon:yes stop_codon:yes gene_type:complete
MASIIRVKRSTGNSAPSTINYGELAVTIANGTQGDLGSRLFVGDNTNPDPDPIVIGGKYFTDMMNNTPGTVAGGANANSSTLSNGFIPILERESSGHPGGSASGFGEVSASVANMPRVNQWNVDNITIDGNTIASNNVDGDIRFVTNGSGQVIINDDTKLTFGASEDASIEYDENGTDKVQVTGAPWVYNGVTLEISNPGTQDGLIVDNIGISSNVIRSRPGGGNTLFIDPYPDGLDSDGIVIVKGSLQVDGTTTTVNSTNTSLNDPIMNIGDVTSKRTVTVTVGSGVSAITIDSIAGINTGDQISGSASLPGAGTTTINSFVESAGISTVFIDGQTTAGISSTTQLTITHGFDTNTDRGISFNYNTGTGVANNKTGFFGFNDSTGETSNAPEGSFTFVPVATNTGNVISGLKGSLDIKDIYFQNGDYAAVGNGIVYANASGRSIVSAGTTAGITTSNFILTTDASGVPKWTTTIDGGQF